MTLPSTILKYGIQSGKLTRLMVPTMMLCAQRSFTQTVNRLDLQVNRMTLKDLKDECRKRGLKVSGRKHELQERIQCHDLKMRSGGTNMNVDVINENDLINMKNQINEAKLQVQRIEKQIDDVSYEVSLHEESQLEKHHLEEDSQEVNAMVDELKMVQEMLDSLKSHAKKMDKDVTDFLNRDGGDITYEPLLNEKDLHKKADLEEDCENVDSLKEELETARIQVERLQQIITSELEAAIKRADEIKTTTTSSTTSSTNGSSINTSKSNSSNTTNGTKGRSYLLSVVGLLLGLGWIFQDSFVHQDDQSTSQQFGESNKKQN